MSRCPLCGEPVDARLLTKSSELRLPIIQLIRQRYPHWQPEQGICPTCALVQAQGLADQRSRSSLHTATEPPTTFPYYHASEATVLAQPERLPDYPMFSGRGVTIAFLDSGYFPHPDLAELSTWAGGVPDWAHCAPDQFREILQGAALRIVQYVDLTHHDERVGVEQPSLWAGDADSWHGQMTTTVALGNGLLSGGRFRGYAPRARLLAIKIGRGGGRIPEEDILRGLNWLLHNNNWRRYNVRVLNVSVGGDFPEIWQNNAVCLAAEALSAQGVLIAAAAGNRGRDELVAPAQAPSVLTVGGYDDANRRWNPMVADEVEQLTLYSHNYGTVIGPQEPIRKPELLALARWLPAPILPVSPVFREMVAIGELQDLLHRYAEQAQTESTLGLPLPLPTWLSEAWQAVRKGSNAHKWVDPYYQHVDGTSVAVAQVSAVAAQMFEANPNLTATMVRALLLATALPLEQQPAPFVGNGILQPAQAVAAALRMPNGILADLPLSATLVHPGKLQKWLAQGTVALLKLANATATLQQQAVYFGYYAPQAAAVDLIGDFNAWQPDRLHLQRLPNGWWQGVVHLPPGKHHYRFWIDTGPFTPEEWQPDPENPVRSESGYQQGHSVVTIE